MIPLVAPCITEWDRADLERAIAVGDILTSETAVRHYEEEFAAYVEARGAVAVNSGTNALVVALKASGVVPNDVVTISTYNCVAVKNAVRMTTAADPELVDTTYNIRGAYFEPSGDVTINSHMFGKTNVAEAPIHDITLSLGPALALNVMVCSTHADKMISTGRGGIIAGQDESFLEHCRELAYYETAPDLRGYSFGMTSMQAVLGRSQLAQLPGFIGRRQEIAAKYSVACTRAGIECPAIDHWNSFFRYIIATERHASKIVEELADRGIEAGRGVNPPLHRIMALRESDFPNAERCLRRNVSIPVHPSLTDRQVDYIIEQVLEVCAP